MKKFFFIIIIVLIFFMYFYGQDYALVKTNMGNFKIRLYTKDAPKTVRNFKRYAKNDKFNNSIFYRVIENFIIQGGGYRINRKGNIKQINNYPPIKSEANNGLYNIKKMVAMARSGKDPHSATSSFFINLKSNKELNYGYTKNLKNSYTVFGKVYEGWNVIKKIADLEVKKRGQFKNYPRKAVIIKDIEIKSN